MGEKYLCVMAGYESDTEKKLSNIQNALFDNGFVGTQTPNLLMHITLGTFPVDREVDVSRLVESVANSVAPFNVTFSHIGIFTGAKVLFIAPDCNRELLALKENFGDSLNWSPHTTMLIDAPETICSALPTVAEQFRAFAGTVDSLHLYEFWPMRHILSVPLAK